eukprot:jgi/Tetstr1/460070/TSEL_005390.t1
MGMGRANGEEALPRPLKGHTEVVASVAFSPDGTRLASASRDNTLRVWSGGHGGRSAAHGRCEATLGWSPALAFSPDGKRLALRRRTRRRHRLVGASENKTVRVWNALTGVEVQPLPLRGHTRDVTAWLQSGPQATG